MGIEARPAPAPNHEFTHTMPSEPLNSSTSEKWEEQIAAFAMASLVEPDAAALRRLNLPTGFCPRPDTPPPAGPSDAGDETQSEAVAPELVQALAAEIRRGATGPDLQQRSESSWADFVARRSSGPVSLDAQKQAAAASPGMARPNSNKSFTRPDKAWVTRRFA
jgi:hypothetical protein